MPAPSSCRRPAMAARMSRQRVTQLGPVLAVAQPPLFALLVRLERRFVIRHWNGSSLSSQSTGSRKPHPHCDSAGSNRKPQSIPRPSSPSWPPSSLNRRKARRSRLPRAAGEAGGGARQPQQVDERLLLWRRRGRDVLVEGPGLHLREVSISQSADQDFLLPPRRPLDQQPVSFADLPVGLRPLPVHLDPARLAGALRLGPCLEEAGHVQPDVQPHLRAGGASASPPLFHARGPGALSSCVPACRGARSRRRS